MTSSTKLILGCGYLGLRVARRWLAAGHAVAAVSRSTARAEQLSVEGIRPFVADVAQPATLHNLPSADTILYAIGHDPTSGHSHHAVYAEGLHAVLNALSPGVRRVILISSTGVYGESDGQWIDESTPCRPTRASGAALLAAEEVLAAHPLGNRGIVLRLAGIYGPGRLPRRAEITAAEPLPVAAGQHINLIHVDDAAAIVVAADSVAQPPRSYVVSDGYPVERRVYLTHLAELSGLPAPQFRDPFPGEATGRRSGDKRINNARMLAELGVRPAYPTYREGLEAIVASQRDA